MATSTTVVSEDYLQNLIASEERLRAELAAVTAQRDALLARPAPVDDDALVEIGAKAMARPPFYQWEEMSDTDRQRTKMACRAAIAAIRPHIEAVEREKLREDIKLRFSPKSAYQIRDETDQLIKKHRESVSDWLEAGSWKQSGEGNE